MTTKNTIEDLKFAEMYLDYVSRRAMKPEDQAKASLLLALIRLMDHRHPRWREVLIADLNEADITKPIQDLFKLPESDEDSVFTEFIQSLTKGRN